MLFLEGVDVCFLAAAVQVPNTMVAMLRGHRARANRDSANLELDSFHVRNKQTAGHSSW
jgi:hypothetical protein